MCLRWLLFSSFSSLLLVYGNTMHTTDRYSSLQTKLRKFEGLQQTPSLERRIAKLRAELAELENQQDQPNQQNQPGEGSATHDATRSAEQDFKSQFAGSCRAQPSSVASLMHPNGLLYVGNRHTAGNRAWCREHAIAGIVNLAAVDGVQNHFPEQIDYLTLTLVDADKDGDPLTDLLANYKQAKPFIDALLARKQAVLVHCMEGVSRAGSIMIAYLMELERLPLATAVELVRYARPQINPNHGFMRTLIRLEQQLFGKTSLSPADYPPPILLGE